MSTLRVTTITTPSGGQPTIDGLARAWVNFNGTGTVAIRASLNVSSITDNATGDYTVNFTTAMPDVNYSIVASTSPWYATQWNYGVSLNTTTNSATEVAPTTSGFRVFQYTISGAYDPKYFCISVFR